MAHTEGGHRPTEARIDALCDRVAELELALVAVVERLSAVEDGAA